MAEKVEKAEVKEPVKTARQKFVERKLKAINNMSNKAKARENAFRLLRGGK